MLATQALPVRAAHEWPSVEILRCDPVSRWARSVFEAMAGAGSGLTIPLTVTDQYHGQSELLMLWGPGAPNRFEPMRRQLQSGGHVLAFDAAYWHRDAKVRCSIDSAHPQAWVMKHDWPTDRFAADRVRVCDVWNPAGPIVIAGIGQKASVQYGTAVEAWEAEMARHCQDRLSNPIWYRPKKSRVDVTVPAGVYPITDGRPIEDVIKGAALVITWHSNVAIDAIRAGIPVVCRDGAAAAVCPSRVEVGQRPMDQALRDRFLANLAWFQWNVRTEAAACWAWIREVLDR